MPLDDCKLLFTNEIFDVEMPGTQLNEKDLEGDQMASPVKRKPFNMVFKNLLHLVARSKRCLKFKKEYAI